MILADRCRRRAAGDRRWTRSARRAADRRGSSTGTMMPTTPRSPATACSCSSSTLRQCGVDAGDAGVADEQRQRRIVHGDGVEEAAPVDVREVDEDARVVEPTDVVVASRRQVPVAAGRCAGRAERRRAEVHERARAGAGRAIVRSRPRARRRRRARCRPGCRQNARVLAGGTRGAILGHVFGTARRRRRSARRSRAARRRFSWKTSARRPARRSGFVVIDQTAPPICASRIRGKSTCE